MQLCSRQMPFRNNVCLFNKCSFATVVVQGELSAEEQVGGWTICMHSGFRNVLVQLSCQGKSSGKACNKHTLSTKLQHQQLSAAEGLPNTNACNREPFWPESFLYESMSFKEQSSGQGSVGKPLHRAFHFGRKEEEPADTMPPPQHCCGRALVLNGVA